MNSFKYEPINLEGHSFRLLRLCKGDFGNVRCEIIHAYVDDESLMEYEALSYTWGGTYKAHDVEIGGSIMAVTQNLSLALKSLRKTREDRILWVDAICIDQNNDKERGHQVRQMTSIYAKAARVLIWLGPATPETDLVFDAMSQFEKEASKHACRNWKISDKRWQGIASSAHLSNKNGQITLNHRQREGLHDLLTRSWFDRVWIIQEVANARAAKVACGTKSVLARTFALFPYLSKIRPSEHCQAILDIMPGPSRKYSWWAESHDLSTLLLKFRGSHASDPRDKVYALLGMSSDRDSESFPVPDYEKTDIEVAQYAIAFLLHLRTGTRTSHYLRTWTLAELMQHLEHLADEACVEAAGHGDIATVKELLCTGKANPNYKTLDGQTPLLRAAEEGYEAIVKHLIDMGEVKVDTRYGGSSTPLLMAVKNRHHEIVSLLLGSGKVDVNFRGPSDWNSLLYAVTSGHDEMVRLLIERGKADVSVRNRHGQTPLLIAAKGGHETACKIILDSNAADVDIVDYSGWDSLCTAAIRGHEAIVHMLLRTKDANAITSTQRIAAACERALALELLRIHKTGDFTGDGQWWPLPLLWVLQHGSVELFELLLKVDLGSTRLSNILRDRQLQERLIGLAAQIGLAEVVKLLLCATKTNLYGKDDWAAEALRRAAADGDCETITTMNASGRAVALFREVGLLDVAASFGQLAVVEHLLDLGLSTPNGKGLALRAAARRGFLSICQRLLECGDVDVNYAPQEGMSPPLRLAVEGGHAAVVKLLLDTPGIVVDAKDVYLGQTPLALAAKLGHADVVELLLGTGNVDCSTRDHRTGRTPLDHARNGRFEDVCEVLNRYGVSDRSTK